MASSLSKPDEFIVRVPKNVASREEKFSLLKFNDSLNVDIAHWTDCNVVLEREDNEAIYNPVDKGPKAGVGSEFGKLWRDEARRKKMGYSLAKYCKDDQPWILTQDTARYKTLDVDEAEEKFSNRNKILNQFALKMKQQLEGADSPETSSTSNTKKREDSDTDTNARNDTNKNSDEDLRPKKSTKAKNKRPLSKKDKKSRKIKDEGEDLFASADSDDGDEEGREVDYMSDSDLSFSSEEEPEDDKVRKALVGVDEEDGIKKLIESDQDDEQEDENADDEEEEGKKKFNVKAETLPTVGEGLDEKASDSGSDSDDPDEDTKAPFFMHLKPTTPKGEKIDIASGSQSNNGKDGSKRKALEEGASIPAKKIKTEKCENSGITLEEVKQYLQRKPQSSKDLVAKFKPKCQGMSKPEVVKYLADILKRLAPEQTLRNGTMYFSIKK